MGRRGEDIIQDGGGADGGDGEGRKKHRVFSGFLLPYFIFSAVTSYSLTSRSLLHFTAEIQLSIFFSVREKSCPC